MGLEVRGCMIRIEVMKVLHFSSCIISKQSQLASGGPAGNWACLSLVYWPVTFFLKRKKRQGVTYKGVQGA